MDKQEQLKEIKKQLWLSMNGEASRLMREKGLVYKVNYGVEIPRLKNLAMGLEKNHELAQALWKENSRECKILATYLQPFDTFYPEIADIWVENITTAEIAEQACMNLFQYMPSASVKAFQWIAMEGEYFQICGYLLLARLFMKGSELNERAENEYLDQLTTALNSENIHIQGPALVSAMKYVLQDTVRRKKKILASLASFEHSNKLDLQAIYTEIKEEAEDFI